MSLSVYVGGVIFDSEVTQKEAESLYAWLHMQPELVDTWPASVIYSRLQEVLADGVVDSEEAADLLDMLTQVVRKPGRVESVDTSTGEILSEVASSQLPVTEPKEFSVSGHHFVFTGKFASGTRSECQAEITERGGRCQSSPTKKTRFLVIGAVGSRDWAHSSWGRKIEKAIELRDSGECIDILSEEVWLKHMDLL